MTAALVPLAAIVAIVALALLPLLTPLAMHPLLDAARADAWLGAPPPIVHALSDATVADLVRGGPFEVRGPDGTPLYTAAEVAHLQDARAVLWLALGAGAVALLGLAALLIMGTDRARTWRGIARGGALAAAGAVALALVALIAFGPLFEGFHRVFFPGGNWAFDPDTSRLVQLYPFAFWQIASAALVTGVVALGAAAWLAGRRMGRWSARQPARQTVPVR